MQGAYPLLLDRPWLKTMHIKQNWQKNIITFRCGKAKVRVPTQPRSSIGKELTPLYAECVNMLEGFVDEEVDQYLQENPKIVPLFEIDVAEAVAPYIMQPENADEELNKEAIRELRQVQEALEKELAVSQRVKASQLEEVNLGTAEDAILVHIAKEMTPERKMTMIT